MILSKREDDELGLLYRVQWDDDTVTEEPASSLVNIPEMVAEFEDAEQAKKRRPKRGQRKATAKKVKYAKGEEAGPEGEKEAGEVPWTGAMTEMQKLMVVMGNTKTALANNAAAANAVVAEGKKAGDAKSQADGSEWKLPGMRDLMGRAKRMKEVGVDHFMEEMTLLRTRRSVMMDVNLPFADIYNEKMSLLVAI